VALAFLYRLTRPPRELARVHRREAVEKDVETRAADRKPHQAIWAPVAANDHRSRLVNLAERPQPCLSWVGAARDRPSARRVMSPEPMIVLRPVRARMRPTVMGPIASLIK
jgi:hypothetical protein